jgi:hypothetical protein
VLLRGLVQKGFSECLASLKFSKLNKGKAGSAFITNGNFTEKANLIRQAGKAIELMVDLPYTE